MSLLLDRPTSAPPVREHSQSCPDPEQTTVGPWGCVYAASTTHRRITPAASYDCVRFVIVRDGSVLLTGTDPLVSAVAGDVLMVAPNAPFGYEPEGIVTVTTVAVDTDYLVEQFFWQHTDVLADRLAAHDHAARRYPEPLRVLHIGETALECLGPLLDDLEALTDPEQRNETRFFRVQALLFTMLGLLAPHIAPAPIPVAEERDVGRCRDRSLSRWALLRPARAEAREAAEVMRASLVRQWRVDDLAAHVCLSSSQFERVFKEHYGLSPMAYLTMLRVQEMARLLRTTDLLVRQICPLIGWRSSHHPVRHFRHYYGVTPTQYRRRGPHTASRGGAGGGVASIIGRPDEHSETCL